jgi:hypothetical protein
MERKSRRGSPARTEESEQKRMIRIELLGILIIKRRSPGQSGTCIFLKTGLQHRVLSFLEKSTAHPFNSAAIFIIVTMGPYQPSHPRRKPALFASLHVS